MSYSKTVSWLTLVLALLTPASQAAADPSTETTPRAKEAYREGSRAFAESRFKEAIDLFLEADNLATSPALAFNTALAYEAMNDSSSALRWAKEYLRRSPEAEDRKEVEAKIDRFERKLRERGVQQLTVWSKPLGASVLIDDVPSGLTPWTGDLRPGVHRIELRRDGAVVARRDVDLRPDRSLLVSMEWAEEAAFVEAPKARAPVPASRVEEVSSSASWLIPLGVSLGGAGAISWGVATGLEVARAGRERAATDAPTQMAAVAELDAMEDLQLGARVAAGLGAGFVALGATIVVVDLMTGNENKDSPAAAVACSTNGCGAFFGGRF
jgi:tetratricopeptide (TPR) repeat protein